jgi:hypothetical protein
MPRRPPSAHGRQAFEQVNVHAWPADTTDGDDEASGDDEYVCVFTAWAEGVRG